MEHQQYNKKGQEIVVEKKMFKISHIENIKYVSVSDRILLVPFPPTGAAVQGAMKRIASRHKIIISRKKNNEYNDLVSKENEEPLVHVCF